MYMHVLMTVYNCGIHKTALNSSDNQRLPPCKEEYFQIPRSAVSLVWQLIPSDAAHFSRRLQCYSPKSTTTVSPWLPRRRGSCQLVTDLLETC